MRNKAVVGIKYIVLFTTLLSLILDTGRVITNYSLNVCSSSFKPLRFGLLRLTSYSIRLLASRGKTYSNFCPLSPSERSPILVTPVSHNDESQWCRCELMGTLVATVSHLLAVTQIPIIQHPLPSFYDTVN